MSYKQFIQELEDDVLPSEAERRYRLVQICVCPLRKKSNHFFLLRRYQEYKSEYISTQKRAYFNAHKDEEW